MADHPLNKKLLGFFGTHVESLERLEILCLLVEHPAKWWSVIEVFREIQSTEKSVGDCLNHFAENQLATIGENNRFQFPSEKSEITTAAVELVRVYRERRVAVIEAIYTSPVDPIQNFANAFRFRKDK